MKQIIKKDAMHILRFEKGEEVISKLALHCKQEAIGAGTFTALGATESVTLLFYDLKNKTYKEKSFTQDMEIVGVTGNIAVFDQKPAIHAHGSFSDDTFQTFSGHIKELVVSAACEVHLVILSDTIKREYDKDTGLNLLQECKT